MRGDEDSEATKPLPRTVACLPAAAKNKIYEGLANLQASWQAAAA
jgi:hypothetical protein